MSAPEPARASGPSVTAEAWRLALRTAARAYAIALCALLVLLGLARTSMADGGARVLIVPLSGHTAEIPAAVPGRFTRVLARMSEARGATVTVAQASLDDTLAIVGCTARSAACLDQAAAALDVDRIVFGRIEAGDEAGTWEVVVTVAVRGGTPRQHRFSVTAANADQAEEVFAAQAGAVFGRARARQGSETAPSQRSSGAQSRGRPRSGSRARAHARSAARTRTRSTNQESKPAPNHPMHPMREQGEGQDAGGQGSVSMAPMPADQGHAGKRTASRYDMDRVTRSSWVITGTGGGLMGTGVMFWLLARQRQGAVDAAPTDTAADLERLVALEEGVETRAILGNTLFLAGTVTAAIGLTLAFRQARTPDRSSITLSPVPLQGGVGVVLRMGGF